MKYFLIVLLFIGFSGFSASAQSNQAIFDEANTYFEEGELSRAMKLYRLLEKENQVSGALFLNMGIVAVQLDSMGLAKYYFLKSAEFEETEDRANTALQYVNNQFSRQSATLPKLPWDRAVEWMIEIPTAFGVFILGFTIICISLFFLYLKWFNLLALNGFRWYSISGLTAGGLLILLSFYVDYVDRRYDQGVIIESSKRVLQSPDEGGNLVSIAYEGYSVIIDGWKSAEYNEWIYIRLGNGQYGWTPKDGIKL